jgi:Uma2 family endonuclease
MAALPALITVEELYAIDTPERSELHHGIIIPVTAPALKHWRLQHRIVHLLESKLAKWGQVGMEMAYRPLPQFELRRADVAAISKARWEAADPDDNLRGAPELVIDAKSSNNRPRPLIEVAALCLATGCQSFWIVDMDAQNVTTVGRDGKPALFEIGDEIPLVIEPGHLPVSEIFASEQ